MGSANSSSGANSSLRPADPKNDEGENDQQHVDGAGAEQDLPGLGHGLGVLLSEGRIIRLVAR